MTVCPKWCDKASLFSTCSEGTTLDFSNSNNPRIHDRLTNGQGTWKAKEAGERDHIKTVRDRSRWSEIDRDGEPATSCRWVEREGNGLLGQDQLKQRLLENKIDWHRDWLGALLIEQKTDWNQGWFQVRQIVVDRLCRRPIEGGIDWYSNRLLL